MNVKKNNSLLLIFIIFLTSFLLGAIFCFKISNYIEDSLLKNYYNITKDGKKERLDLSKYWLVFDIILNNYYDINQINDNKLVESSVDGLVKGLNDKHSSYLNKEENIEFNEALAGDFEGIGAVVKEHPLGVEVDRIIKGSPAKEFDIRTGDIIISANNINFEGFTVSEAVNHIKGPAGTEVKLQIIRAGERQILNKSVLRQKIKIPSVDIEDVDKSIGFISLNMFGDETSKEFLNALNEFKNKKGIIIDLRDNGGGYLSSAVEILSNLIKRGDVLVVTKYKDDKVNDVYKSINNGNIYEGKIIILINENSASASEIVAGALKDYKKAILVGQKSYGKGSVQMPFDLPDGSMLKLTIAKWFTPNGINIDEEGIIPDIKIDFLETDYIEMYDRQKEEAINILREFIEKEDINIVLDGYSKR